MKVSTLTLSRRHKGKKAAYVRPIKASDERTLENAIIMANQLASKSMHDLDKRCVDDMFNASPQESPVTPNSSTKKFTFKFPSSSSGGGSSSGKQCCGSGYGSTCFWAFWILLSPSKKKVRKTLIPTAL